MSRKSAKPLALLVAAGMLMVPITGWSQASAPIAAPEDKLHPVAGNLPPDCATCGTVVAITRVDVNELPRGLKEAASAPSLQQKRPLREVFEVVVRLSAGTQQIVTVDRAPKLTIGQRVRITDGVVVPDMG